MIAKSKVPIGRGRVRTPDSGCNPLVKFVHENIGDMTYKELAKKAGIHVVSLQRWRYNGVSPLLGDIEAVINAMGYDLVPVKRRDNAETL